MFIYFIICYIQDIMYESSSPEKASSLSSDPFQVMNSILKLPLVALKQFQDIFLYGNTMNILHKEKPKEMYVYLDNNRQKFLWISSKTKAFLLDLYFTELHSTQNDIRLKGKIEHYLILTQFEDEVVFIFQSKQEKQKYFNLFSVYIDELRKNNQKYTEYFSLITRTFTLESTKKGSTSRSEKDILQVSSKIGLSNKSQNQKVLSQCCKFYKVINMNEIPFSCVNQYFKIQFCSRSLQPYFEKYSEEKLGNILENPRLILKEIMAIDEFKNFLRKQQNESEEFIAKVTENTKNLSFFDFCLYIYDKELCSISRPPPVDQSHPLNHYFCYSSHNTYLSGNQLTSDSKVERYTEDFENGVKCVELDVHNDGYTPIVTHALKDQSLCKPILFEDIIKEVDRFSEQMKMEGIKHYPIILSIENHATQQNRQKMLHILSSCFDNLYYVESLKKGYPTLKELRGKIMIKTSSKERQLQIFQNMDSYDVQMEESFKLPVVSKVETSDSSQFSKKLLSFQKDKKVLEIRKDNFNQSISAIENLFLPISSMAKVTSIFKAAEGIKTHNPSPYVCTSLTNAKVLKTKQQKILQYTKRSWLRTYPQGSQVGSGNYDPAAMMHVGAQIVALNTQTKDDFAWMTYGYFSGGRIQHKGQTGYVLKPKRLLPGNEMEMVNKKTTIVIKLVEKSSHKIKMKFYGVNKEEQKVTITDDSFVGKELQNVDESFVIFNIDDKYKDCVALRFIAPGFRILEGKNKDNYLDCGIRIVVHVKID